MMKNKHEHWPINETVGTAKNMQKRYTNELLGSILCANTSTAVNVGKHTGTRADTSEETIWRIRVAGWVRKVTRTRTDKQTNMSYCFSAATVIRECACFTLYVHCLFFFLWLLPLVSKLRWSSAWIFWQPVTRGTHGWWSDNRIWLPAWINSNSFTQNMKIL
jgi:hypothetical protein